MPSPLFSPLQIGPLTIANRIIVAPMCQYSAIDGNANEWHRVHLGAMANSGAALVMVEATAPEARGRITPNCLGLYSDDNETALESVLATVRAVSDVKLGIQIGHAGRKASSRRPWDGRDALLPSAGGWQTLSPSGIKFGDDGPETREMSLSDMHDVIAAHVQAVERARRLGFDLVELHAGHGYLLSSFLSPLSNLRDDEYGGTLENRMRFPLEVAEAVRSAWPEDRALSIKFNGNDWAEGGFTPDDAVIFARALADVGVDLITASGGGVVTHAKPPVAPGYQLPAAEAIKLAGVNIKVAGVGMLFDPHYTNSIIESDKVDAVSLARAFLFNPKWAYHAATVLHKNVDYPPQYQRASPALWPPALALTGSGDM
jgi:2,4-dienoyl-CoA reductase-like NADH-dependent reductase (Old Yellow Enzyme family)